MTQDCFFYKSFSLIHAIVQAEKYLSQVKISKYAEVLLFLSNLQLISELLENDNRDFTTIKWIIETYSEIPAGKTLVLVELESI